SAPQLRPPAPPSAAPAPPPPAPPTQPTAPAPDPTSTAAPPTPTAAPSPHPAQPPPPTPRTDARNGHARNEFGWTPLRRHSLLPRPPTGLAVGFGRGRTPYQPAH